MTYSINETHDPNLKSWVESANDPNTDFPIQNLPFCVFIPNNANWYNKALIRNYGLIGIRIGNKILSLGDVFRKSHQTKINTKFFEGLNNDWEYEVLLSGNLNNLSSIFLETLLALRSELISILKDDCDLEVRQFIAKFLFSIEDVTIVTPFQIGDYTDFYASIFHATNIGKMFRPDNPLLPNYKHIPIGYHGRASSVVVSGTPIHRPSGQTKKDDEAAPKFGASKVLDYEIELGFFVGPGNNLGEPIKIIDAENHIFGLCLVNDWSARDLQRWEYQPLGPFLAKSFATTISPWIVTMEALAPFRSPAFVRDENDPEPLAYLDSSENRAHGGFDINIELYLASEKMREQNLAPLKLVTTNAKNLYWTLAQMLTHHASNGCNMRPGDLIASGTISGETKDSYGSLMEFTWQGTQPFTLPSGETRKFLEDGDEVILRGYCERAGFRRIGFGECRGIVMAALQT